MQNLKHHFKKQTYMIKIIVISKTKNQKIEFSQVVEINTIKRTSKTHHVPSHLVERFKKIATK